MSCYTFSSLLPMSFCINKCISKIIFPWCTISILRFHQVLLCDRFSSQTRQKSWLLIPISVSSSRPVLLGYPCKPRLFLFLVAHARSVIESWQCSAHVTRCSPQHSVQWSHSGAARNTGKVHAAVSFSSSSKGSGVCQSLQQSYGIMPTDANGLEG